MKIPFFRRRDVTIVKAPPQPPPVDACEVVHPRPDAQGCPCLERRTSESGEVWSTSGPVSGEMRRSTVLPLTGFMPRGGFAPPKVIVSDPLNLGVDVDVLFLEPDEPTPAPTLAVTRDEIAAALAAAPATEPRRPIVRPPTRVRFVPLRRSSRS